MKLRRPKLLSTGDMARLSSNTVRTVRFYEETGVLEPAHRSEGGHRLFPSTELDKLVFISNMRDAGLSLEEIRLVLGVKAAGECGASSSERLIGLLGEHVAAMTAKIDALSRLRAEFERAAAMLGGCLTCTQDSLFPAGCGRCEKMQGSEPHAPHAPHHEAHEPLAGAAHASGVGGAGDGGEVSEVSEVSGAEASEAGGDEGEEGTRAAESLPLAVRVLWQVHPGSSS